MIRSMTAFARNQTNHAQGDFTWELRSVNHRYLEAAIRMPEDFRPLEPKIRERLQQRLGRGKIDANLRYVAVANGQHVLHINQMLLQQLIQAAQQIQQHIPTANMPDVDDMLRWPGILQAPQQDMYSLQKIALASLDQAIDELIQTREREGKQLAETISQRLVGMRQQVEQAKQRIPTVLAGVRERLTARLQEITDQLDQDRLEQEMVILSQRLDVDEEMDRLATHLDEVQRNLQKNEPVGRRLDFLMQELNREANTLGSKSVDSQTTAISVEMKVLIEQMREQVQNIE